MADQTLPTVDAELGFTEQLEFLRALRPLLERHDKTMEALHPRGKIFIRELFGAQDDFVHLLERADAAQLDLARLQPVPPELAEQIGAYLDTMRRRIRMIEALGEEDEETVRSLREAYKVQRQCPSTLRRASAERHLLQLSTTNKLHASTLKRYGISAELLQRARLLHDTLRGHASAEHTPEQLAVLHRAEEAEERVVDRVNKAFAIADAFRDEHPELFSDLASVTAH
jgi:hypothetical protein